MSKLTPTTIILMIAGLGAVVLLFVYYRKKKADKIPDTSVTAAGEKPASAQTNHSAKGFAPMQLVKTPVGYVAAG